MALRITLQFPETGDLDGLFDVRRAEFSDRVSELFELTIAAVSAQGHLEPTGLVGRRITVLFDDERALPKVAGIVRTAKRNAPEPTGVTRYELTVVPAEWLLSRARRTRIFQALAAPDVAANVLQQHGLTPKRLTDEHAVREYCVQHDETDWQFVRRILAEDGTATIFDHAGGSWNVVDDTRSAAIAVAEPVAFNPSNLTPGALAVLAWTEMADVETPALVRRDFDYAKPRFVLQAAEAAGSAPAASASLEDYEYQVGAFADDAAGRALVTHRLQALRATVRRVRFVTNFALAAGMRFSLHGAEIHGDWFVVGSSFVVESTSPDKVHSHYEVVAIPGEVPYRPPLLPKPRFLGTQTAFVVGDTPSGTVDTDALGRVKVEFRWDRRDLGAGNPTRWIRVAQAWAGAGFGLFTLPRVGDEVLVAYADGDPDQPLVIGRVHNAVSTPPLSLPDPDKTKATWRSQSFGPEGPVDGFNLIALDDAAGAEAIDVHAQLDYRTDVNRDMTTHVGRDRSTSVVGDDKTDVKGSTSRVVRGSSSSDNTGPVSMSSASTMSLHAHGDLTLSTAGDRTDQTASNHFVKAGSMYIDVGDVVQVNAAHFHVFAKGDIRLVSGGSSIVINPGGINITSSGNVEVIGALVKLNC